MRYLLLSFCFLIIGPITLLKAQGNGNVAAKKCLIYFTDKKDSPYSISQPLSFLSQKAIERRNRQNIQITQRDLPVNPAYLQGLKDNGITVWYSSRWFNAAIAICTAEELAKIEKLPFVKATRTLNNILNPKNENLDFEITNEKLIVASTQFQQVTKDEYGPSFHQVNMLGADELHRTGFRGQNMTIAVLDAGFPSVQNISAFSHLFNQNRIIGTYDFVDRKKFVYDAHPHGTAVLSTMAAFTPGKIIGTAYQANYILLRTEDAASEHNIEEINWLLGAEYADSAGADVINSSLGYSTFNQPSTSYTYTDMNGNTTLVAKAADYAAAAGILVVTSAGNEGAKNWRYISSPADADSVLTVGAVDSTGIRASFSSFGPTSDNRIKPDVVAMGLRTYVINSSGALVRASGTSFSGPLIAGFTTALWQANLQLSNYQMIELMRKIGNQAQAPDNSLGYGVPSYQQYLHVYGRLPEEEQVLITNPVHHNPIVLTLGYKWQQNPIEIQVVDATGKLVHQQTVNPDQFEVQLDLPPDKLSQGLYLCQLRTPNLRATVRFVKL